MADPICLAIFAVFFYWGFAMLYFRGEIMTWALKKRIERQDRQGK